MAPEQSGKSSSRAGCITAAMPREGQAKPDGGNVMGLGQCRKLSFCLARFRLQPFKCQLEHNPWIVRRQPRRPLEPAQPVSSVGALPGGGEAGNVIHKKVAAF